MIHHCQVQTRGAGARYPGWLLIDIEAETAELAMVLAWEWGRNLHGLSGQHRILGVVLGTLVI